MTHGFWWWQFFCIAWLWPLAMIYLSPMAADPPFNDPVTDLGEEPYDG